MIVDPELCGVMTVIVVPDDADTAVDLQYVVQWSPSPGFAKDVVESGPQPSPNFELLMVETGSPIYVRAAAINSAGQSNWSQKADTQLGMFDFAHVCFFFFLRLLIIPMSPVQCLLVCQKLQRYQRL